LNEVGKSFVSPESHEAMKATASILTILISLCLCSCKKEKGAVVETDTGPDERVVDLEEQLGELREKLVDEQNLRLRQNHEQTALLADLKDLLKGMAETRKAPAPVVVAPLDKVEEEKEAMDPNAEARRVSRLKAQGEELAHLVTKSGEQYEDLVITRVTDLGVVFRHKGGIARVPFSDLDATWQKRFYHDHDRALLALKHERMAQARYDRAVAANIEAMNERENDDAFDLSLERLAQAVANINQPAPANPAIVENRIPVNPPIILNHDIHYDDGYYNSDGIYCPPIVRPAVIRQPVETIPPGSIPTIHPPKPQVKPNPRPTVRPTPSRPTIQRPATPRPTTSKPVVQRPRPTPQRPATQRPVSRPTPSKPTVQRPTPQSPAVQRPAPSRPSPPVQSRPTPQSRPSPVAPPVRKNR
jgi:hypothetical protein